MFACVLKACLIDDMIFFLRLALSFCSISFFFAALGEGFGKSLKLLVLLGLYLSLQVGEAPFSRRMMRPPSLVFALLRSLPTKSLCLQCRGTTLVRKRSRRSPTPGPVFPGRMRRWA